LPWRELRSTRGGQQEHRQLPGLGLQAWIGTIRQPHSSLRQAAGALPAAARARARLQGRGGWRHAQCTCTHTHQRPCSLAAASLEPYCWPRMLAQQPPGGIAPAWSCAATQRRREGPLPGAAAIASACAAAPSAHRGFCDRKHGFHAHRADVRVTVLHQLLYPRERKHLRAQTPVQIVRPARFASLRVSSEVTCTPSHRLPGHCCLWRRCLGLCHRRRPCSQQIEEPGRGAGSFVCDCSPGGWAEEQLLGVCRCTLSSRCAAAAVCSPSPAPRGRA
jgi:hypothetical protein